MDLMNEVKTLKNTKLSFAKSIKCYFGSICRKDKNWRLKEKIVDKFEE